jgi:hypothetical protein
VNRRQTRHVGDPLELGRALGLRNGALPAEDALVQIDGEQLAAGHAQEDRRRARCRRLLIAHGQRGHRPLQDPAPRAVGGAKSEDVAVARPDDDGVLADRGGAMTSLGHARRPLRFAGVIEREHLALGRADDDELALGASSGSQLGRRS